MAEQAAKEPSMEEILSSIRRIISEGGEPGDETAVASATPAPATETYEADSDEAFDVSELLDDIGDTTADNENEHLLSVDELLGDDELDYGGLDDLDSLESVDIPDTDLPEDISAEPAVELDSAFEDIDMTADSFEEPAAEPVVAQAPPIAATAAPAAAAAAPLSAAGNSALEGLVSELMKPVIKEWIDTNLPNIVERRVEAEINQIAAKVIAALRD